MREEPEGRRGREGRGASGDTADTGKGERGLDTEGWEMRARDEAQRLLRDEVESRGRDHGLGREDGREGTGKEPERRTGARDHRNYRNWHSGVVEMTQPSPQSACTTPSTPYPPQGAQRGLARVPAGGGDPALPPARGPAREELCQGAPAACARVATHGTRGAV